MKNSEDINAGLGISVPSDLAQVVIYFIQKDQTKTQAVSFCCDMASRGWENSKGFKLKTGNNIHGSGF